MRFESSSLLVLILVGLVAGWLAGKIMQGAGFGIIGDIVIGIVGAFFGTWLLGMLGIAIGGGIIAAIINATIGAVLLLAIIRLIRRI
ncbi:MAG TPA: GlsB/YeaQ/YmgE family stress response membrane protein [Stellaceae bacterium]|nr:GlsB/YeaQ/YmgE family stress response membrane protein [Stellaceae bacterium]